MERSPESKESALKSEEEKYSELQWNKSDDLHGEPCFKPVWMGTKNAMRDKGRSRLVLKLG